MGIALDHYNIESIHLIFSNKINGRENNPIFYLSRIYLEFI